MSLYHCGGLLVEERNCQLAVCPRPPSRSCPPPVKLRYSLNTDTVHFSLDLLIPDSDMLSDCRIIFRLPVPVWSP
ncbi:hypothetical protein SRHO_G00098610 [Serrasalmus rhombeus]